MQLTVEQLARRREDALGQTEPQCQVFQVCRGGRVYQDGQGDKVFQDDLGDPDEPGQGAQDLDQGLPDLDPLDQDLPDPLDRDQQGQPGQGRLDLLGQD